MGLEPMTSCVTGRRSNLAELTHQEIAERVGFEPTMAFLHQINSLDRSAATATHQYLLVTEDSNPY